MVLIIIIAVVVLVIIIKSKINEREERERGEQRQLERQRAELEEQRRKMTFITFEGRSMTIGQKEEIERKRKEEEERKRRQIEEENRKRQLELERRERAASYMRSSMGGFNFAYLTHYYPKNRYPDSDLNYEAIKNRKMIWSFKDGYQSSAIKLVSEYINSCYSFSEIKSMYFCVIPASTNHKNSVRYEGFCNEIAKLTGINNSYSFITVREDKEDSREHKSNDTTWNLDFDSSQIFGKKIILFDDVMTRGTSFCQVANKLKSYGAVSIMGLFLGKTY